MAELSYCQLKVCVVVGGVGSIALLGHSHVTLGCVNNKIGRPFSNSELPSVKCGK